MKESTVIYKSYIDMMDLLLTNDSDWKEAMMGLLNFGFTGETPETDNPLIKAVYVAAIPTMKSARDRYTKAVENGKKGGRKPTIDRDKVFELKESGYTHQEIADELGCSKDAIKKIIQREGTKGTNREGYKEVHKGDKEGTKKVCTPKNEDCDYQKTAENIDNLNRGTKGTNLNDNVNDNVNVYLNVSDNMCSDIVPSHVLRDAAKPQKSAAQPEREKREQSKRMLEDLTDKELIECKRDYKSKMKYLDIKRKYNLCENIDKTLDKTIDSILKKRKSEKRKEVLLKDGNYLNWTKEEMFNILTDNGTIAADDIEWELIEENYIDSLGIEPKVAKSLINEFREKLCA